LESPPLGFVIADQCLIVETVDLDVIAGARRVARKFEQRSKRVVVEKMQLDVGGRPCRLIEGLQLCERIPPDAEAGYARLIWPYRKTRRLERRDDAPERFARNERR